LAYGHGKKDVTIDSGGEKIGMGRGKRSGEI